MIYMLGGPPRAKKTSVGEALAAEYGIPFVGTDAFAFVLERAAPQLGISLKTPVEQRQKAFLPYLRALIECQHGTTPRYLIEGEAICPLDVPALAAEFPITACFVGFSSLTLDELLVQSPTWVEFLPGHEQRQLPDQLLARSRVIEEQCSSAGVPYIDVSGEHDAAVKRVVAALVSLSAGPPTT